MATQRRIDLVLDSVKRLVRLGATANLLNLLQKQHPADLAQIFSELQERDRQAAFSLLADRNGRLAMEAVSELGPEAGAALLATRPADPRAPRCRAGRGQRLDPPSLRWRDCRRLPLGSRSGRYEAL